METGAGIEVKALIFDLGGTLLYLDYPFFNSEFSARKFSVSEKDFYLAVSRVHHRIDDLAASGVALTDALRWQYIFAFLLADLHAPFDHSLFIEEILRPRHASTNLWNHVFEGTAELLGELKQRYRLAMISNSDGRAEAKAVQYGLREHLEFVLDSHLVGIEKPDGRIFLQAAERLGIAPEQCAYIGDIYSVDVLGARAAAMFPVLIDKTETPRTDCLVIPSLFDLRRIFK